MGKNLNNSTQYNCIVTELLVIHKKEFTDSIIIQNTINKHFIPIPQAYTRCSLTALNDKNYITSDEGIRKTLLKNGFNVLHINPKQIILPGFKNGFYGGTNGVFENKLYQIGKIENPLERKTLNSFLKNNSIRLIELYDGALYDAGGIFFGK